MNNIFNIYVLEFLKSFDNTKIISKHWESVKNQKKLKKILKNSMIKKDPAKPKRGKSGFLFFCDEMRPVIKLTNHEITVKEVVSQLGVLWQQLKIDGNTAPYEDQSIKDRERYRTEMEEYRKRIKTIPVKTPANSVKVKKTPCEKKVTAFDNYLKSKKNKVKEKHPDIEEGELIQVLKNKWKKLALNKRAKYIKSV